MRSAVRSDRHGQRRRALPGLRWPSTESQSWSRAVSCRETGAGVQPSQGAVSPPHVTARVRVQAPCAPHSLLWNHGWPAATALDSADSRTLPPSWKSLRWWPRCPQHCPRPLGPFGGSLSQGTASSAAVTCAPCCSEVLWHGWAAPGPAHWGGQPRARAESCSLGTRGPQSHSETQSHPSSATGCSVTSGNLIISLGPRFLTEKGAMTVCVTESSHGIRPTYASAAKYQHLTRVC